MFKTRAKKHPLFFLQCQCKNVISPTVSSVFLFNFLLPSTLVPCIHGPLIWGYLAINRQLALSHTGNTQHPQTFLWGAREPESVAGRCPIWMMTKIKHTCTCIIHTSTELLKECSKGWICFFFVSDLQRSEQPVSNKHHYNSVRCSVLLLQTIDFTAGWWQSYFDSVSFYLSTRNVLERSSKDWLIGKRVCV